MRIIQVVPDFALGGIQKGGCVLAAAMAAAGHEAHVVGFDGGERFLTSPPPRLLHHCIPGSDLEAMAQQIESLSPDVIHIHRHAFWPEMIERLTRGDSGSRVIVSTPVFGRAPINIDLLEKTRTCHVGTY